MAGFQLYLMGRVHVHTTSMLWLQNLSWSFGHLINLQIRIYANQKEKFNENKQEGKDQESIQSSTTPDPGHHMGRWQEHKGTSHTSEPRDQPFPSR